MRFLEIALLLLLSSVVSGCGAAQDLPAARRTLPPSERAVVRELSNAPAASAALLRSALSHSASPDMAKAVENGEVVDGMSAADVLRSWGEPDAAKRPWLITDNRTEFWSYQCPGRPDLGVHLQDRKVHYVGYWVTGTVPAVPRGDAGYLKQWPGREVFKDSHW